MAEPTAVAPADAPVPIGRGVRDLYGELWAWGVSVSARWHLAVVVELAMIATWFLLRTTVSVDGRAYAAWLVAAGLLALVSPISGLVVLVGTSAFFEPDSFARSMSPRELILAPLVAGVLIRIAADRFRWRPEPAVWVALLLLVGTALSLVTVSVRFSDAITLHATRSWVGNVAAPLVLLVAAAWTARRGDLRVLVAAVVTAVVVAVMALAEYASPGLLSTGPLDWIGFWKSFGARLAGLIPSPNGLSAQLIVPTMLLSAAVLFARDRRLRILSFVAVVPLIAANYLTYSRSPLVAVYAFVVIAAWRVRRAAGILVLVAGLVVGILALPSYLSLRAGSVSEGAVTPGSVLVASDQLRFRAWGAAIRMWADEPLTGQGFLAYKELGDAYGDPVLGSPHNEWLRLFAEGGTIVGLLGVAWIVTMGWSLARIPGWLGTGLLAGLAGYVIAATFNNPLLFFRISAIAFPILGVGLALAERARGARTAQAPPEDEAVGAA